MEERDSSAVDRALGLGVAGLGLDGEPSQCPLQFAMQQLAHAAVAQLVYYAHGEYVPRPELARELERWQRLHDLIARRICPASRAVETDPSDLDPDRDAVLALIPEGQFAGLRHMLARCSVRQRGDACPLERDPVVNLFDARDAVLPG